MIKLELAQIVGHNYHYSSVTFVDSSSGCGKIL